MMKRIWIRYYIVVCGWAGRAETAAADFDAEL